MKTKRSITCFFPAAVLICLIGMLQPAFSFTNKTRQPAWSDSFYPDNPAVLEKTIRTLCTKAAETPFTPPSDRKQLKALILPHAGYKYSGLTAAHASLAIKNQEFKKIVIIGPDHRVGFSRASVTGFDSWKTPLGTVKIHSDAKKLINTKPERFRTISVSDAEEHSLEVIVPFLQIITPGFQLVPITIGRDNHESFVHDLQSVINFAEEKDTLIVASSDLSHFLPLEKALEKDSETIDLILKLHGDSLKSKDNTACGITPILSLVHMARKWGWKPCLIHRSTSYDGSGDKNRVVGYAAIAFYGGSEMKEKETETVSTVQGFNESQGKVLIDLARKTISDRLGVKADEVKIPDDPLFNSKRGTFVTLKINKELRGCIGNLSSTDKISEGVRQNAISAAFNDFRFRPLTKEELERVEIEVSILTEPEPLVHSGGKDLLSKLKPGIDGVIIRKGGAGATFLPQVWDQLPKPAEFMEHLCRKAGLPKDAWKSDDLGVSTYQVQYFEE